MTARTTLPTPKEKALQGSITRVLRMLGAAVWDTSQPHRALITKGLPDLLVFHRGRFTFVEVKRPGGRLTEGQRTFQAECQAAGVEHHVWTSSEDAMAWAQETRP
jgi:hypothetical protein